MSSMASKSTKIMPYLVDTLDITYPLSPPELFDHICNVYNHNFMWFKMFNDT